MIYGLLTIVFITSFLLIIGFLPSKKKKVVREKSISISDDRRLELFEELVRKNFTNFKTVLSLRKYMKDNAGNLVNNANFTRVVDRLAEDYKRYKVRNKKV